MLTLTFFQNDDIAVSVYILDMVVRKEGADILAPNSHSAIIQQILLLAEVFVAKMPSEMNFTEVYWW